MTEHDYSQYTREQTIANKMPSDATPLGQKAECTCGWVNRRTMRRNAVRARDSHADDCDGEVTVEETESPLDSEEDE